MYLILFSSSSSNIEYFLNGIHNLVIRVYLHCLITWGLKSSFFSKMICRSHWSFLEAGIYKIYLPMLSLEWLSGTMQQLIINCFTLYMCTYELTFRNDIIRPPTYCWRFLYQNFHRINKQSKMESRLHVCFNQIMQYFKNNEILTEKNQTV